MLIAIEKFSNGWHLQNGCTSEAIGARAVVCLHASSFPYGGNDIPAPPRDRVVINQSGHQAYIGTGTQALLVR